MAETTTANHTNGVNKRTKFVKLAEARTAAVLAKIRVLENLANKTHYEYSDVDAKKIFGALTKAIESARGKFFDQGGKKEVEFKLGD